MFGFVLLREGEEGGDGEGEEGEGGKGFMETVTMTDIIFVANMMQIEVGRSYSTFI